VYNLPQIVAVTNIRNFKFVTAVTNLKMFSFFNCEKENIMTKTENRLFFCRFLFLCLKFAHHTRQNNKLETALGAG